MTMGPGARIRFTVLKEDRDVAIREAMIGGLGITALARVLEVSRGAARDRVKAIGLVYDKEKGVWS